MTTHVTGITFSDIINDTLDGKRSVYSLGNNESGDEIRVTLNDTKKGTRWEISEAKPAISLMDGNSHIPVVARKDFFRGGENQKLVFEHPDYPNRIEVTFSPKERR